MGDQLTVAGKGLTLKKVVGWKDGRVGCSHS